MNWRHRALSAASIVLAVLVWAYSPHVLDWIGLADFDPLDRICLLFLVLSVTEAALARVERH